MPKSRKVTFPSCPPVFEGNPRIFMIVYKTIDVPAENLVASLKYIVLLRIKQMFELKFSKLTVMIINVL